MHLIHLDFCFKVKGKSSLVMFGMIFSTENSVTLVDLSPKEIFAGLLESANWSILAARDLFKEVVGKKSGFYVNEIFKSQ